MIELDPGKLPAGMELVNPFPVRRITHVFHDVDGTHSLIRNWVPVMTLCTGFVAQYGLPEADDAPGMAAEIARHTPEEFPEAHRFAVESAGLSALTQMEWAIRRALQNGVLRWPEVSAECNDAVVARIWAGGEDFDDIAEPPALRAKFGSFATRLFQAYEILLLQMGRDRNLADAKVHPERWRVAGSMEFLQYLSDCGVHNYFVTGAVVEYDEAGRTLGTMAEEVRTLGFGPGPGMPAEKLVGSTWHERLSKERIMIDLCRREHIAPEHLLIVGDGRGEISAGKALNTVTLSRLPKEAARAREIHRELGTNLIAERFDLAGMRDFMRAV